MSDDDDLFDIEPEEENPLALTPTQERVYRNAEKIIDERDPKEIFFQHTALCQTYLPYRDQKDTSVWVRKNGNITLMVQAGFVLDPDTEEHRLVGIPFGAKVRLVLAHLNTRALKSGSNIIELEEDSFTTFVKHMQNPLGGKATAPNGRELKAYKEQLLRLSAVNMTLAHRSSPTRAEHKKRHIIEDFDVSFHRDGRQRVLWPESISLSDAYWQSLQKHAVPLDGRALAALAHSGLALDLYQWLAQRLHRIEKGKPLQLSRSVLHQQFGEGYERERDFWSRAFKPAMKQVLAVYGDAKVSELSGAQGLSLEHSLPPVARRSVPLFSGGYTALPTPDVSPAPTAEPAVPTCISVAAASAFQRTYPKWSVQRCADAWLVWCQEKGLKLRRPDAHFAAFAKRWVSQRELDRA